MATIRAITEGEAKRHGKHSDVDASVTLVELDGEKYLQIDTFGSDDRQMPNKVSQSLRFSEKGFADLTAFAQRHFDSKA